MAMGSDNPDSRQAIDVRINGDNDTYLGVWVISMVQRDLHWIFMFQFYFLFGKTLGKRTLPRDLKWIKG